MIDVLSLPIVTVVGNPKARSRTSSAATDLSAYIANGLEAWDEVLHCNYEGMVAKDPESAYTPGHTLAWLKVKQRDYRQEARGFHPG